MKFVSSAGQLSSLLLATLLLITPVIAQQKQPTTKTIAPTPTPASSPSAVQAQQAGAKEDELTFDTLLAAKSYKLYGEVRMIGQLARSTPVIEMLEPARLLGSLPVEVKGAIQFLYANADALATSRVMFVASPVRSGLPQNFVAVELASPEDAIKLEPKFRSFFSSLQTSIPAPAQTNAGKKTEANKKVQPPKQPQASTAVKSFFIQRTGGLILMSDASFALKNLRPDGSQLLAADPNFQRARSRFASEPLFIYYDIKLALPVRTDAQLVVEPHSVDADPLLKPGTPPGVTEITARPGEQSPAPARTVAPENPSSVTAMDEEIILAPGEDPSVAPEEDLSIAPEVVPPPEVSVSEPPPAPPSQESVRGRDKRMMAIQMFGGLFGGAPSLPDAIGMAAALEGGDVVVRALLINASETPNVIIPFFPSIVSGPEITPRATSLSPADTALFVSLSLDMPRTYDAWLKGMRDAQRLLKHGSQPENESSAVELQMALFEQALGFKIKEDLFGALGNEVALDLPANLFKFSPNSGIQPNSETAAQSSQTGLTVFISLNDKERVRELLPRVLEVIGIKAPGAAIQTEKRARFEITNYGMIAMAFIDDFLVVSPEVAALRSVIDAHENNQTLASNPDFKNSTNWQASRMLGQVYLSPELTASNEPFVQLDDQLQELFSRFNQKASPITHAVVSDNAGFFHELHLPKDWITMFMAGLSVDRKATPIMNNELSVVGVLMMIRSAQTTYKEGRGKGSYATREQLVSEQLVPMRVLETEGYRLEITTTADKFQVTATPTEYGKTGRQSFYLDESGVIRGADHGGQPGSVADKPL
ncbi:MAG TPA: DUF3352 domain-containing protein [Pyrinomonadaceae bacterium]